MPSKHLSLPFMLSEITDQYLAEDDNQPWVLGFSGGKDSTLMLQLTWKALAALPEAQRSRPVYVVCNDTGVENPRLVAFIEGTLQRIEQAAPAQQLPILVQRTLPALADSFWLQTVGKGYPAPDRRFRWCTDRLKIKPTTKFIQQKISDCGRVIVLLGTREDESANRARSMRKHAVHGQRLRKHVLPGAHVYAPIRDVQTADLWQYLSQCPPPWGGSHKELITLYRNASTEADCPLVIDTETPSCGKSRFGCWVCTVVNRDKSMEGLIENGEAWMEPLSELRDQLMRARDEPATYRQKELRRGYIREEAWGPYLASTRAALLKQLLEAQHSIQQGHDETLRLIGYQELVAIQAQWHQDGIFSPTVAEIYNAIYSVPLPVEGEADRRLSKRQRVQQEADDLLREVCGGNDEHYELIQQSLQVAKTAALLPGPKGKRLRAVGVEQVLDNYLKKLGACSTG